MASRALQSLAHHVTFANNSQRLGGPIAVHNTFLILSRYTPPPITCPGGWFVSVAQTALGSPSSRGTARGPIENQHAVNTLADRPHRISLSTGPPPSSSPLHARRPKQRRRHPYLVQCVSQLLVLPSHSVHLVHQVQPFLQQRVVLLQALLQRLAQQHTHTPTTISTLSLS